MIKLGFKIFTIVFIWVLKFENAWGLTFSSFELGPELKQRQIEYEESKKRAEGPRIFFGANTQNTMKKSTPLVPISDTDNELFSTIKTFLNERYQEIGTRQVQALYSKNQGFDLGKNNFSGFVWQKPMGHFDIVADRKIFPNDGDSRWVVFDAFLIAVDALSYLSQLDSQGQIKINPSQLQAFAGLKFYRIYTYRYFVDTYEQGIGQNFDKLFLGFMKFHNRKLSQLGFEEVLTREDYLSFHVGAIAEVPIYKGLEFVGGLIHEKNQMSKVTIQTLSKEEVIDTDEFLRLSIEKQKGKSATFDARLQIDFMNLLKISLLRFEYTYEYVESEEVHLSFKTNDLVHFTDDTKESEVIHNLIKMRKVDYALLAKMEVSREFRKQQNLNSKLKFLIFGIVKKQKAEQVIVQNGNDARQFLIKRSEDTHYTDSLLHSFLNALTQSIFDVDLFSQYKSKRSKSIELEYENHHASENFSIQLGQEFAATQTTGSKNKKYKNNAIEFLIRQTAFDEELTSLIQKEKVRGPIKITVSARIHHDGIQYFDNLPEENIYAAIIQICDYDPKIERIKEIQRVPSWEMAPVKNKYCYQKLTWRYNDYQKDKFAENKIWTLADFVETVNYYSENKDALYYLFGIENVYFNGKIVAQIENGEKYNNYFKQGVFKGAGIISQYLNHLQ